MELLPVLKSLGILFVAVAAGWFSRRRSLLAVHDTKSLGAFIYSVALPALFFSEINRADFGAAGAATLVSSLAPVAGISLLLVLARALRLLSRDRFVMLGLAVVFGSNAFFGVPFFEALYGQWGLDMAVITGSFLSIFGIIASVALFEYAGQAGTGWPVLARVARSPLVIAIALGALSRLFKPYGGFLIDALMLLGRTAPGLAIFMLGMFMHDHFSPAVMKKALPLTLFRVIMLPLATALVLAGPWAPAAEQLREFLLLQSGIPAAISIAVFAQRYQYKAAELSGMVVLTSLAAFFMLALLYALI